MQWERVFVSKCRDFEAKFSIALSVVEWVTWWLYTESLISCSNSSCHEEQTGCIGATDRGSVCFLLFAHESLHLPDLSKHGDICKTPGHRWQVDTQMPRLDTAAQPALSHSWMYTMSPQPGLNYNPLLLGQELAPAKPEAKRFKWLFNCNGILKWPVVFRAGH